MLRCEHAAESVHEHCSSGKPTIGRTQEVSFGDAGIIQLATGRLTLEALTGILKCLPADLTFVDAEGCVRFFSDGPERVFPRTPAVIGRNVENCHLPDSVDMVRRILYAFKSGSQDEASFWFQLKGRFILVRFHAIRGETGDYMGCLEISQDVTDIRTLEGERRLLNWDE